MFDRFWGVGFGPLFCWLMRTTEIAERIRPMIAAMGFNLVRVKISGGRRKTLQVMVERPDGSLDVQDCAEVSRALSATMDMEDPFQSDYILEVSSPGIDRPLVTREDYERFAGHRAKIKLHTPLEGRKRFVGTLLGLEGDVVALSVEEDAARAAPTTKRLPFSRIEEAKLVLTDALLAQSLKGGSPGEAAG